MEKILIIYKFLIAIGFPSLFAIGVFVYKKINAKLAVQKEVDCALKLGMQALLRDRLLQAYRYFKKNGSMDYDDKENWLNMYNQYHSLGENGVMDSIKDEVLKIPVK